MGPTGWRGDRSGRRRPSGWRSKSPGRSPACWAATPSATKTAAAWRRRLATISGATCAAKSRVCCAIRGGGAWAIFVLGCRCAGGGGFRLEGGQAGHGGQGLGGCDAGGRGGGLHRDGGLRLQGRGRCSLPSCAEPPRWGPNGYVRSRSRVWEQAVWGSSSLPVHILVWRCGHTTATQAHIEHYLTAQDWRVIEDTSAAEYVGSCAWG